MTPPVPYRRVGPVTLYPGDAARVLSRLPAGCVDTVVTPPPYWGLRDYRTAGRHRGDPACAHTVMPPAAGCGWGAVRVDPPYGLEPDLATYLTHLTGVCSPSCTGS